MKKTTLLMLLGVMLLTSCNQTIMPNEKNIEPSNEMYSIEENKEITDIFTIEKAIDLIASSYYLGDRTNLYGEEISRNIYVVRLAIDFGSGLLTNTNAFLIMDGKIKEFLYDTNTGEFNEDFWGDVNQYK